MGDIWPEVTAGFVAYLLAAACSIETAKTYERNLRLFARWALQHSTDPLIATRADLQAYVAAERLRISQNTVAMRLAGLRAFYAYLIDSGRRTDDPTTRLRVKVVETAAQPPLTEAEIAALFGACRNDRDRAMITVALRCGLRVREVVGIRSCDVDLERGVLLLTEAKGGDQRWVGLDLVVQDALRPFLADEIPWRTWDGRPLGLKRAKRNMEEIARRAGVHVHWHKLRTTFAVKFLRQTHDLDALQTIMGHKNADTTRRYARWEEQERALAQMRTLT